MLQDKQINYVDSEHFVSTFSIDILHLLCCDKMSSLKNVSAEKTMIFCVE